MRLSKFFKRWPNCNREYFFKFTRKELDFVGRRAWVEVKELNRSGDKLAYRAYMLRHHGLGSVVNSIMGDHGRPNRY